MSNPAQHLRSLLFVAVAAFFVGPATHTWGQTTQPARKSHAEMLKEVAKKPIVAPTYQSPTGKPLTDAEKGDLEKSNALMEASASHREKGDYEAAGRLAKESLEIRIRLLGGRHYLTLSAGVISKTMDRFTAASGDAGKKLGEADKQFAAAIEAHRRGDYAAAREAAQRAVAVREQILGKDHAEVGLALRLLGSAMTELHELDSAEATLKRALEIVEAAYGKRHPEGALILDRLGWLRINSAAKKGFDRKTVEEAATTLRRAVSIFGATVGETTETAEALDNLGTILVYMGSYDEALANKLRSLFVRETLLGPDDSETAVSLSNLGWLYGRIGMQDEVIPLKRRALAILTKALGPHHPYTMTEMLNLARVYRQRGMTQDVVELLETSPMRGDLPPDKISADVVNYTLGLGIAYQDAERYEDAERMLNKAFRQAVLLHAAGAQDAAISSLEDMSAVCRQRRMIEDAIKANEQLQSWEQKRNKRPNEVAIRHALQLAQLYISVDRLQDAIDILTNVLRQLEILYGSGASETFVPFLSLSLAHEKKGELDAAERFCEKALRISEAEPRRGSPRIAHATAAMGRIYSLQKKYDMARFSLEEAKELHEKYRQADPVATVSVRYDLAAFYLAVGQKTEALDTLREALQRSRELAKNIKGAGRSPADALLAKSIKLLLDAIDAEDATKAEERTALKSELKTLLEKLRTARALDADNKRWLEELTSPGH